MQVGRMGLSPVMVGRRAELARLERLLEETGEPRVALIGGEAGIGKTRLVQELLTSLPDGVPVLAGQAERDSDRPFQLLLEAVESFVAGWTAVPDSLAGREQALRLLLAPVAPALALAPPSVPVLPAEALLRGAVDLVRHLSRPHPQGGGEAAGAGAGVVVFEDLHWADPDSLNLFARLAASPGLPILLLGTYRAEALNHRLSDLLTELERRRSAQHVSLRHLRRGEVAELLATVYRRPVPATVADALHQRTAGNPFFIEELLVTAGSAQPEELPSLRLPVKLTEAVLHRLDGLGPVERRVVDAAAVLGQRISFDLLAAVTGMGEDELIGALRALVGHGLIVEADADIFSFRHALTREAVAGRLLGRERRRFHEKAMAALREFGTDDWAALAHHAAGAGRWDEMVDAARAGARQYLRAGSTFLALDLAERALQEADGDLELLEVAARAAWSVGLYEQAIERTERWRRLAADAGRDQDHARALRVLARLRWETGEMEVRRRLVDEALAVAGRLGPSEEQVWVYSLAAEAAYLACELECAVEWADRALALTEQVGAAAARPAILVNKGSAMMSLGDRRDEAVALIELAVAEGEAHGDYQSVLRGFNNLLVDMHRLWPAEHSHAVLERMASAVERFGWHGWQSQVDHLRLMLLAGIEGDLLAAREILAGMRLQQWDPRHPRPFWSVLATAELAYEAGDLDETARLIGEARSARLSPHDPEHRISLTALAAVVAACAGQLEEAAGLLEAAKTLVESGPSCQVGPSPWFRSAREALRAGVKPSVIEHLTEGVTLPDGEVPDKDPAWPDHLNGALREAEGEPAAALEAYRSALEARERHRPPATDADVHQGVARCLLALGREDEAREHAEAAVALLARWPGWRKAEAVALLRRLGGGTGAEEPAALTPREREVAALLADGLSNADLARRLYISRKTVSVHVSNILAKLGMSSRTEVAAWVVRQGLDTRQTD